MNRDEQFRVRVRLECLHLAAKMLEEKPALETLALDQNGEPRPTPAFLALAHELYSHVVEEADGGWWSE